MSGLRVSSHDKRSTRATVLYSVHMTRACWAFNARCRGRRGSVSSSCYICRRCTRVSVLIFVESFGFHFGPFLDKLIQMNLKTCLSASKARATLNGNIERQ